MTAFPSGSRPTTPESIASMMLTNEESAKLRTLAIAELTTARPDLVPEPYDPTPWACGILVTIENTAYLVGVPASVRGRAIYVRVRSLGNRILTPQEIAGSEAKWLAVNLEKMRIAARPKPAPAPPQPASFSQDPRFMRADIASRTLPPPRPTGFQCQGGAT